MLLSKQIKSQCKPSKLCRNLNVVAPQRERCSNKNGKVSATETKGTCFKKELTWYSWCMWIMLMESTSVDTHDTSIRTSKVRMWIYQSVRERPSHIRNQIIHEAQKSCNIRANLTNCVKNLYICNLEEDLSQNLKFVLNVSKQVNRLSVHEFKTSLVFQNIQQPTELICRMSRSRDTREVR